MLEGGGGEGAVAAEEVYEIFSSRLSFLELQEQHVLVPSFPCPGFDPVDREVVRFQIVHPVPLSLFHALEHVLTGPEK